jgi:hypothetical protein
VPAKHQSAAFVFGHFENQTGWTSSFYVVALDDQFQGVPVRRGAR